MEKVLKILLIEDDELDQIEFKRALDKKGILYKLKIVKNGEEGLHYLRTDNHNAFKGRPDMIILDVNTPKMNGIEFLKSFRENGKWDSIKVFVLANSEQEKKHFSTMRVSGFIAKPLNFNSPSKDTMSFLIDMMNL